MSKYWLFILYASKVFVLVLGVTLSTPQAAFGKSGKLIRAFTKKSNPYSAVTGASLATAAMVGALDTTSTTEPARPAGENDTLDPNTANYIQSHLSAIKDNYNAIWIFETSIRSLQTVFKGDALSSGRNFVKALKQTACIFVAETHYGNLPEHYDECDQTNIGQIRPPAYKEIYEACPSNFGNANLSFLGKGTNCKTLHPYEMPLCCEAVKRDEKDYGCRKYDNDPLRCISKQKRDFLENMDLMTATTINSSAYSEGVADPIVCKSTSGSTYIRIPAVPMHSIFASIFYLKLIGYEPMSDASFAAFGAKRYNAANKTEQQKYQLKLNTCLDILDKPENSEIITEAYKRAVEVISKKSNTKKKQHHSPFSL